MSNEPFYWKSSLEDIDETLQLLNKGKIIKGTKSAGGRKIDLIFYGKKNDLKRTANLSSALGAGEKECYADKTDDSYRPTIFLVGCIHGGEFEGSAALCNLIKLIETGTDYKGEENIFLQNAVENVNLLIIPCLNPDGRSRIDFNSFVGKSFEELRYYNQGTWKDGSLCGYPECKRIHPIKEHCEFLGAYFNDDGVNLMHDDFFGKKAPETQFLFDIVDEYVPDFTILLHGGANCSGLIFKPTYSPRFIKEKIAMLDEKMKVRCEEEGLRYYVTGIDDEDTPVMKSFNLVSALYHFCGEPCVTYESNQGLTDAPGIGMTHDEIYRSHIILFEEVIRYTQRRTYNENS